MQAVSRVLLPLALLQSIAGRTGQTPTPPATTRSHCAIREWMTRSSSTRYAAVGGNPYESHPAFVPFVRRLVDGRLNGARLVTFDPRLSKTAGRSDRAFHDCTHPATAATITTATPRSS